GPCSTAPPAPFRRRRACNRRTLRSNRCPSRRSRSGTGPPSPASSPQPFRSAARRCATPSAPWSTPRRSSPPASTPAPGPRRSPPPNSPPSPHAPGLKSRASCGTPRAPYNPAIGASGAAMREYQKILLCVDLTDDSDAIATRGKWIAQRYGAELTPLHVVEYVPVEPMGEALLPAVQIEGELMERARLRIAELATKLGLGPCDRVVQTGNIKADVIRFAQERGIDLIVIGSRERHGVSILFNFTEDTVLHAAPCDVLAVRLHKDGRAAAAVHGNS